MARLSLDEQSFFDPTPYGSGPTDSVTDQTENRAVTRHQIELGGKQIPYTAIAGHLVTVDADTSQPAAKIFYVGYRRRLRRNDPAGDVLL